MSLKLQRLGIIMKPEEGNEIGTEGVLNPAPFAALMGRSLAAARCKQAIPCGHPLKTAIREMADFRNARFVRHWRPGR
jgi:hypothetical protein